MVDLQSLEARRVEDDGPKRTVVLVRLLVWAKGDSTVIQTFQTGTGRPKTALEDRNARILIWYGRRQR